MRAGLCDVRSSPKGWRGRQQHRDHRKSGKKSSDEIGLAAIHGRQFQELSKDSDQGIISLVQFGCTVAAFLHASGKNFGN